MLMNRLSALACQWTKRTVLQRIISRSNTQSTHIKNRKDDDDDEINSEPIKYSSSPAAEWLAKYSQQGRRDDAPWYQPRIVFFSTLVFLIYFVYLREANDIDELLDRELGDHFPDLKEADIRRKLPPEVIAKRVS